MLGKMQRKLENLFYHENERDKRVNTSRATTDYLNEKEVDSCASANRTERKPFVKHTDNIILTFYS